MQDTKLLEDNIKGLKAKLKTLRTNKEIFDRAQGMAAESENLRGQAEKMREDIRILKESNAALIAKKNSAVSKSLVGMMAQMKAVLPEGDPILSVSEDGDCFIGWKRNISSAPVAYSGLSGGEKILYDAALCNALKANIIVSEFAELDDERLPLTLQKFAGLDVQVICSSCHDTNNVPEGFTVVRL
ncbi:MAG: hypothetical protein LLG40_13975 [Deltaproteobacteria bacterium]|nr:hypothetical protein [Deltaproteobacteria bacterium]